MLEIRELKVGFPEQGEILWVVKGSTFSVTAGEVLGIVGESGSGKSMTALALTGLLPPEAIVQGEMIYQQKTFSFDKREQWQKLRGTEIGLVFQDPASSLNPLYPVGRSVWEALRYHLQYSEEKAKKETEKLFSALGILPAAKRVRQYPHQLSGGLKQRVMLAAAICCRPAVLIADEPTTALDVTVQAQILKLLHSYVELQQAALVLISHDLGVIAQIAERVIVMCQGVIVEEASVYELYQQPLHPYTKLLLTSLPRLDRAILHQVPQASGAAAADKACVFAKRCQHCQQQCLTKEPVLKTMTPGHLVCCHFPLL
ncbi:MAG TPA: ABC transporter ATP-binding protein [Oscillospiraceae bacterium]|nr:ABC transporter ATP-binding protein [Oscillospiraceae bacterium]